MATTTARICCGSITGCIIGDVPPAARLAGFEFQIPGAGESDDGGGFEIDLEGALEVVAGEVFEFPIDAHAEGGGGPVFLGDEFPMGFKKAN